EGIRKEVLAALGRTRTVTRGPKPVRALKEVGLTPTKVAAAPTTSGVISTLEQEVLQGKGVGLTLYAEPNPPLVQFLESAGGRGSTVMSYIYTPDTDAERVAGLIESMARREVDAIVFTSSPQVDRLYEVANERDQREVLQRGLKHTRVAAVGPVVAENLRQKGARVDICPDQGFVMKNLVQQ